jgi:hypothetical protein
VTNNLLLFILALFANFTAEIGRKGSKKEKRVLESHFTSLSVWDAHFVKKKSKSLAPTEAVHCTGHFSKKDNSHPLNNALSISRNLIFKK